MLFADNESISKKYKLTAKAEEDLSAYSTGNMDPKMVAQDNKMKSLAIQRQKKGQFLKLATWALYHRSTLKSMNDDGKVEGEVEQMVENQVTYPSTRNKGYRKRTAI